MAMQEMLIWIAKASYFLAAVLFILGIKRMSSPVTARKGIIQAGIGMVIATLATFAITGAHNIELILLGIAVGVIPTWLWGKKVAMTDMPQMVALFNGMGGGSAAAIGAGELLKFSDPTSGSHPMVTVTLAVLGALIGSVSMTGSIIAWAKLDGVLDKRFNFPGQQVFNFLIFAAALVAGIALIAWQVEPWLIVAFFALALLFGILMTLPIGGADMPVVISLFNALTGLAVAFEGYVMQIEALIIAGTVVGAAGTYLTQLMAKAMNRPISGVLFSNFGGGGEGQAIEGAQKPIEASDAASLLYMAEKVIIVPGYGMAVAQAQHKIWELTQALIKADKEVLFAIHPVAGRMPGHMNVLLAEAGVPYDLIADMDDINPEFKTCDVAIVIGANDVVNPAAKTDKSSPIYGMPILNVVDSRQTIVIKRGKGTGFAGIENALFYADNTRMLYADGKDAANQLIGELKGIEGGGGH
ncbi:NAD(P)(+) transhydrogenase (Re/Si-specific) subunit beta [Dokdonella sp.]|uniref:NAD(P)(+) transhydrogenase (Re/Si-specific) subunit beta n=1 Tax=Dokdonella sp. TaxID=2291710 RepID=UPI0035290C26